MIDFGSLKEQLKLLGHDLPEEQIINILQELNIEYGQDRSAGTPAPQLTTSANLQDNIREQHKVAADHSLMGAAAARSENHIGYDNCIDEECNTMLPSTASSPINLPAHTIPSFAWGTANHTAVQPEEYDSVYNRDSIDWHLASDQEYTKTLSGYSMSRPATSIVTAGRQEKLIRWDSQITDTKPRVLAENCNTGGIQQQTMHMDQERVSVQLSTQKVSNQLHLSTRTVPQTQPRRQSLGAARRVPFPASADDDTSCNSDTYPTHGHAQSPTLTNMVDHNDRCRKQCAPEAQPKLAQPRPEKYNRQQQLRDSSPSRSSTISIFQSTTSFDARSTRSTNSATSQGPQKVDRVARYQQLQQAWSKDRFLKDGGGKQPAKNTPNFHTHFAQLHAYEAAEKARLLKASRARTAADLAPAAQYIPPTTKRRDDLRWETRLKLREAK